MISRASPIFCTSAYAIEPILIVNRRVCRPVADSDEQPPSHLHCGHRAIFSEEIPREMTGIILNDLSIVLTIFLQVKQDDKNNTMEIFKSKQTARVSLVFYTTQ